MIDPGTGVRELNAILEKMVRNWVCIVNLDAEFCFSYDKDDPNPRTSTINGYRADTYHCPDFGTCIIGDNGNITVTGLPNQGRKMAVISTSIRLVFPEALMQIFRQHVSQEIFEHPCNYIGFDCKIDLPDMARFSVMIFLNGSVRDIRLDAWSETVLRTNVAALSGALQPYTAWFDYAAALADQFDDEAQHAVLIRQLRMICAYLGQGGQLSFEKLTSLCDVAGNLQPVCSVIQKKTPQLVF